MFYFKKIFLSNIASEIHNSTYQRLSKVLFIILGFFLFQELSVHFYETFVTGRPHNTKLGDWVINYNDGFVRRGLIGQILLYLDWYLFIPLLFSTFVFTVAIVIFKYFFLYRVFLSLLNNNLFWFILFLSPAFLLFTFYDFEGGFRKENLGFLSFIILIYSYTEKNNSKYLFISLFVFFLAAFSHEMNSFFLPFYLLTIFYLYKYNKINKNLFITFLSAFTFIAITSIIVSFNYSGFGQSPGICETVTNTGIHNNICGGSIFALEKDIHFYIEKTFLHFPNYPIYYTPLLLISLFPIYLIKLTYEKIFFILFSFIIILPLFFIAADWGRWISIYCTYLYMLIMMFNLIKKYNFRRFNLLIVFIFILSWYIPVYDINENTINLLNNLNYITNPITYINNPGEYKSISEIIVLNYKYLFKIILF